jgi:hypothetical protein
MSFTQKYVDHAQLDCAQIRGEFLMLGIEVAESTLAGTWSGAADHQRQPRAAS